PSVDINYWAVLVAAAVNMAVGMAWYSTSVYGRQWARLVGKKMEDMRGGGPGYWIAALGALVQAYILAHFVDYAGATTVGDGLVTGFWLWLGLVAVTLAVGTVFEGRSWKLWQINAGYFLVVL